MLKQPKSYTKLIKLDKLLFLFTALLIWQCASIKAPPGGPVDVTPPEILSVDPQSGTTNLDIRKIRIEFSEYMDENSSGVETHSITCQEQRLLNYDEAHNVAQEPTVRQDTRFSAAINVSWTSESSASSFEVCASFASTSLHSRLKSFVVLHGSFMRARQE